MGSWWGQKQQAQQAGIVSGLGRKPCLPSEGCPAGTRETPPGHQSLQCASAQTLLTPATAPTQHELDQLSAMVRQHGDLARAHSFATW